VIEDELKAKLTDEILFGALERGGTAFVSVGPKLDDEGKPVEGQRALAFRFEARPEAATAENVS
jgi:hypothetical protein